MERNEESEGLLVPMSRSSQAEGVNVEDPKISPGEAVVDDMAEAGKDLNRKKAQSPLKGSDSFSCMLKRRKSGSVRPLEASRKRKRGGGSLGSLQAAAKKSRRSAESFLPLGNELNFMKSENPEGDPVPSNFHESSDDSEPLIKKINKKAAKRAQNLATEPCNVKGNELHIKNSMKASNATDSAANTSASQDLEKHALNSLENKLDNVDTKHKFPVLKDFVSKSLRTSKRKSKIRQDSTLEDKSGDATGFVQITKIPELEPSSAQVNEPDRQKNLSIEVKNATLKWSNHKVRQNLSGNGKRAIAKNSSFHNLSGNGKRAIAKKSLAENTVRPQSGSGKLNNVTDEEHSLEQYAARTLSSRFSPNGSPFAANNSGAGKNVSGPVCDLASAQEDEQKDEGTPLQIAGKALRPRKQKHNSYGRKCYREICFSDSDAHQIVNRRIKVFWPLDNKWYCGMVRSYDPTNKLHYVRYDDRDEEWLQLRAEKFKLQLLPGESVGGIQVLEKASSAKVRGRQVSKCLPSLELRNELQTDTVDKDMFKCKIENRSSKEHAFTLSNAPCQSEWYDHKTSFSAIKDANSLAALNVTDTGGSLLNSDKKKTEKVYVRRRHLNIVTKDMDVGISKVEKEKVSKDQNSDKAKICSASSTSGLECLRHSSDYGIANFVEPFKVQQPDEELSEKKGLEYLHTENGSRKEYGSCYWLELLFRLNFLKRDDHHPHDLEFTNWRLVLSEKVYCGNPMLSLRTIFPLLYPRCGLPSFCCHNNLILRQCGVLMSVWLDVWLDILVVDDFFGSSLFSFGGSLHDVVKSFSKIVASFLKPLENHCSCMSADIMKVMDFKLPVPSLSFRISSSQGLGNPLDFVFYDFQGITRENWTDLLKKLEVLCFFHKRSSLESPHCANSRFLHNYSGHLSGFPTSSSLVKLRSSILHAPGIRNIHYLDRSMACGQHFQNLFYNDFYQNTSSCRRNGCIVSIKSGQEVPPFSLTFASASSFFLGLHSNLMLGKAFAPCGSQAQESDSSEFENWETIDVPETDGDVAPISDASLKRSCQDSRQIHGEKPSSYLDRGRAVDCRDRLWQTAKLSKVDVDASPVSTSDGWVMSSSQPSYSELSVTGTSAGLPTSQYNNESYVPGNVFKLRRCPTNRSSWRLTSRPRIVQRINPPVGDIEADISFKEGERDPNLVSSFHSCFESARGQLCSEKNQSTNYADTFPAKGNYWSQNKYGVASSSQLWKDQKIQHLYNGSLEPRKRRSGFSNLIFSENADGGPFKYRGHMRRGRPSRQNKEEKMKKSIDNSSDLMCTNFVSCRANILVVGVDRGWRESGAEIVLEASEHNEWMLSVKLCGYTKYTHKAQQVVQSGSTNRYTHAMIWKGGKDWSLEFAERKQWALFKEMHEECYNRNLRAASVKHIPIPGVREIDDCDCGSESFPFARPSSRYIRLMESEVEMALATSRVMYDMDSEDEEWLDHLNNSRIADGSCQPVFVSEETFERIMDLLEKAAFTQQRELLNSDEVADFCWDIAPVEVVKAIHAHWQEKRWRKGMALVRHFQPASWERYQLQLKEWESQMNELQNSPTANKQQLMLERPPMFAFCLKPRGLEVPNKAQRQRSHRKFNAGQHFILRDQENGVLPVTKKQNGIGKSDDTSLDALGIMQSSSPSEMDMYYQPTSFGAVSSEATMQVDSTDMRFNMHKTYQQKQKMKLAKRKSKKKKIFLASNDPHQEGTSHYESDIGKQYASHGWETSSGDHGNNTSYVRSKYNLPSMNSEHSYASAEINTELRVQEAVNAVHVAAEQAALRRARAQRFLQKTDLLVHKAAVAVVIAETIRAAERNGQEESHIDVESTLGEKVDLCKQKISGMTRDSRENEANSVAEESGRSFSGHWMPAKVDPYGVKDDGTSRQSPTCSAPASLPSTSCFMPKMQADVMPVATFGSSPVKKESDSNQVPDTVVEESLCIGANC